MSSASKMDIWVSLPRNDLSLAEAALRGGAAGVKVHLNAFHRASGTRFGSFAEERPFLEEFSKLPGRKAVMIGQDDLPSAQEMAELKRMGFEGFNLYLRYSKPYLFESGIRPIPALEKGFTDKDIQAVREIRGAWIEASIVDPANYGQPLSPEDVSAYRRIVAETKMPVLVPSQKKLAPSDLGQLKDAGVHAVLIGVIVTGSTPESIEAATREFVAEA